MGKYILKRLLLMVFTAAIIMTMLFIFVKLLPDPITAVPGSDSYKSEYAWRTSLGYYEPLLVQYGIYLKNLFTTGSFGVGFKMYRFQSVTDVFFSKMAPTMYVNFFSLLLAIPLGLGFGIFAALKKNKWQDQVISVLVMIAISVPSFVYAFLLQYLLCYMGDLPLVVSNATTFAQLFTWTSFRSYIAPILCLSLGTIAGLTRFTRAELTEVLTSDFMLLARAKGLTRGQATTRHALRNAMVPIFPMIMGEFISIIGGSLIIEQFFSIPGVGALYLASINEVDYNFFMFLSMFYVVIGLLSGLVIDLSYGVVDPRIRMGAK
ncbi:MAG: ABC transporter permease [Bacilli bacterium]|jgi:ABC-type dipeptide/oligopeptide/nickel transport system permease component|nr:ABC transporter permease [Bacilli bacterium]MCH4278192.1 ABC transporter permease [Bacilli bacterium]